jgi:hypothetical protein
MKLKGKPRSTWGKTCPGATLSSTNPVWTDSESNPGLYGGRPAANRLSHGTAVTLCLSIGTLVQICKIFFSYANLHLELKKFHIFTRHVLPEVAENIQHGNEM